MKLVVANWKCNPTTLKEAKALFDAVRKGAKGAEVVVCPPFVYLPLFKGLPLGAQNCLWEEKGAYTGEISPLMLKNMGIEYVIIGHSERRKHFGETDEQINKKINKASAAGLKVIFCIGETEAERSAGKKNEVLERQIKTGLAGISNSEDIIIAYEPVWAIGTGNNCSVQETKQSIEFIRETLVLSGVEGQNIRILYGGSVNGENSGPYIKEAGANGLLVGGASLKADEFIKIVRSAA